MTARMSSAKTRRTRPCQKMAPLRGRCDGCQWQATQRDCRRTGNSHHSSEDARRSTLSSRRQIGRRRA
eukprot:7765764-Lingulodinium_polyedra.AAC.1